MTLHFIHIGKTGGTAIKSALRSAGLAYWDGTRPKNAPETPYGRIMLHRHHFRLRDVPAGDYAFFCVRDPIARFVSGFDSRLRKGRPSYDIEWTAAERQAFEAFPTPQRLAAALGSDADHDERRLAQSAMADIRHLSFQDHMVGTPRQLRTGLCQVVYIARQETLGTDWEQITSLLGLPADVALPLDPVRSHRRPAPSDSRLGAAEVRNLQAWYGRDFRLMAYCDRVRAWRGWGVGPPPPRPVPRLRHELSRLRGLPALLPPPPARLRRRIPIR